MSFKMELMIFVPILAFAAILSVHFVAVPSGSMDPVIKTGDVVLVQKTDVLGLYGELNPDDIKVGDITVYDKATSGENNAESEESIIHRVVGIDESNGERYLILKGDNNPYPDEEEVPLDKVTARALMWSGNPVVIPYMGDSIAHIKSIIKI